MTIRNALILSLLLAACQTSQAWAGFTVNAYSAQATVVGGEGVYQKENAGTKVHEAPDVRKKSASVSSGSNSSETVIRWTLLGDSANLKVSFSHVLGSAELVGGAYSIFEVQFQVSTPSILTASGFFYSDGTSTAQNMETTLISSLNDWSLETPAIFNSTEVSHGASAPFILGDQESYYIEPLDLDSSLTDSKYIWIGSIFTLPQDFDSPTPISGSISGELLLTIRPVPEAASFIIWSVSLAMMCAINGRHRSKARVIN